MNAKVMREIIKYFYPLVIILLLLIFKIISFFNFIFCYLAYCTIIYLNTKTYLFFVKTEFNEKLLEKCPSIKNPCFKQYFFLPFTFCQFLLGEFCKYSKSDNKNKLLFEEEKIDDEGTSLYWGYYEKTGINHRNPVLFILPGITGNYEDTYIQNTTIEALNNNYDVVIFQMRTLSSEMKMPKNKYVDFYEDINKSLIKIKNKNKNIIHAIGFSYGANLLCGYLGNKNLETNYIEGGIAISNPFDLYFSQRFGEDTLYESLISYFEKKSYMKAVNSLNKNAKTKKELINVDILNLDYYVKTFDTEFFGKILGYKNGDDYYKGISSAKYIKNINKPLLVIHSKDDPICTYKGIPMDDICENKNIIFILTDKGGHTCFVENGNDFSLSTKQWIFKPAFEFINYLKNVNLTL